MAIFGSAAKQAPVTTDTLQVREDDYSIQIADADDRMFWLRVERQGTGPITVSDIKFSEQSDERVAAALQRAVSLASPAGSTNELLFLDIAPSYDLNERPERAKREAAAISKMIVLFAKSSGQKVVSADISTRGHKYDLKIQLAAR